MERRSVVVVVVVEAPTTRCLSMTPQQVTWELDSWRPPPPLPRPDGGGHPLPFTSAFLRTRTTHEAPS